MTTALPSVYPKQLVGVGVMFAATESTVTFCVVDLEQPASSVTITVYTFTPANGVATGLAQVAQLRPAEGVQT